MSRNKLIISLLVTVFITSVKLGTVHAADAIRITGYGAGRTRFVLADPAGGPPPGTYFSTMSRLYSQLTSSSNFGDAGVVKCDITGLNSLRSYVSTNSLVSIEGNLNYDMFFGPAIDTELSDEESSELAKFVLNGGVLYLSGEGWSGTTPGQGPEYNLLFEKLDLGDRFNVNSYYPGGVVLSSSPDQSIVTYGGPFGDVGPVRHAAFRLFDSDELQEIAFSDGTSGSIHEGRVGRGYISVTGSSLFVNSLYSANNMNYYLNLISLACDKSWQDSSVVLEVPSFKQGLAPYNDANPVWENETYDDGDVLDLGCDTNGDGAKMAECACALTSANMVMAYYGIDKGAGNDDLLPGLLNTYSKTMLGNGVFAGFVKGNFRWDYVGNLTAQLNKVNPEQPKIDQPVRENYSLERVKELIDNGTPVILRVNGGAHWVVVKGYNPDTNQLIINDPSSDDPTGGTYQYLEDLYTPDDQGSMIIYTLAMSDYRYLQFAVSSESHLLVTNSNGEKTGYDTSSGQTKSEIPNSDYVVDPYYSLPNSGIQSTNGMRLLTIKLPEDDEYRLQIVNYGKSDQPVFIYTSDKSGNLAGKVINGKHRRLTVSYDEAYAGESVHVDVPANIENESKKKIKVFPSKNKNYPVSIGKTERDDNEKYSDSHLASASYIIRFLKSWLKY